MTYYWGIFFISLSLLSLEISLVRLLSVTTWYHLAFFAISIALLGMTAGATKVFVAFQEIDSKVFKHLIFNYSLKYSISIPIVLIILCLFPMGIYSSVLTIFTIFITITVAIVPFYFAGIVITILLTKTSLPIGKIYGMDLIGASFGCIIVLVGLEIFDAPSFIIFVAAISSLSSYLFSVPSGIAKNKRISLLLIFVFIIVAILNSNYSQGIRPLIIKGQKIESASNFIIERWNSYSRVAVYPLEKNVSPQLWAASPVMPNYKTEQYRMNIDGEAATVIRKYHELNDIEHLKYDVTNIAYYLKREGKVCIIGIGGGKDIQSAIIFGHLNIDGVEYNPIFIDLLKNEFKDFVGISKISNVKLNWAEARNFLTHSDEKYQIIQMSLVDTWAATGAGAFSLSENTLYTVEAWKLFFSRLDSAGVFTVSRWYSDENLGETGRIISLATKVLIDVGILEPAKHIILVTHNNIASLVISRNPYSEYELELINRAVCDLKFEFAIHPLFGSQNYLLNKIVSSDSDSSLENSINSSNLNYSPPTDDNPYFFNMLKLNSVFSYLIQHKLNDGVIEGNLIASLLLLILLICLIIISIFTILIPIKIRNKEKKFFRKINKQKKFAALYFVLIGAGFMLTEIGLIQKLTTLLTHPLYALGLLLFGMILSTGIGSLLSEKLIIERRQFAYILSIITSISLFGLPYFLAIVSFHFKTSDLFVRILVSIALIFPIGLLLGMFFPLGIRVTRKIFFDDLPWFWALNGIFGVLFSVTAIFISIYFGIVWNFYIASILYLIIIISTNRMFFTSEAEYGSKSDNTKNIC